MSKGSKPRPFSISKEKFDQNWDRIFVGKTQVPSAAKEILHGSKEKDSKEESRFSTEESGRLGLQQTEKNA